MARRTTRGIQRQTNYEAMSVSGATRGAARLNGPKPPSVAQMKRMAYNSRRRISNGGNGG